MIKDIKTKNVHKDPRWIARSRACQSWLFLVITGFCATSQGFNPRYMPHHAADKQFVAPMLCDEDMHSCPNAPLRRGSLNIFPACLSITHLFKLFWWMTSACYGCMSTGIVRHISHLVLSNLRLCHNCACSGIIQWCKKCLTVTCSM